MPSRPLFAEQLRMLRKSRDLTQRELAARAGYAFSTVRKVETGELRPSRQLIGDLARALDLDAEAHAGLLASGRSLPRSGAEALAAAGMKRLPLAATPLVGRASEVAAISAMLADPACRLVSIVGPGGIGKTRLALAAAHAATVRDGAVFVPLAAVASAEQLPVALLTALHIAPAGEQGARDVLLRALETRALLLVLDNFEHLVDGWPLINELLQRAPQLAILTTSQQRLSLRAEWIVELSGLSCPEDSSAAGLEAHAASELFLQRLRQAGRRTALDAAERGAVLRICRLVEGLPLAIELAAMASAEQGTAAVAAALSDDITALATTLHDGAERHRSLWAMCEYAWQLLSETEQRAFAAFAVFRGGWDSEAARAVAGTTRPLLAALVRKSLLRHVAGRYEMHEVLRRFAAARLLETHSEAETGTRHLAYYLALAEEAAPELLGPEQAAWSARLTLERDNLRAALQRAIDGCLGQQALRLALALWRYWDRFGPLAEGRDWLQRALHTADAEDSPLRAEALAALGFLCAQLDSPAARVAFSQSLAAAERSGDRHAAALALLGLGRVEPRARNALPYFSKSLALFRGLDDRSGMAWAYTALGDAARFQHQHRRAARWYRQSLSLSRGLGDAGGIAWALAGLAEGLKYQGSMVAAGMSYAEALELFRALGDRAACAWILGGLGDLAFLEQEFHHAAQRYAEALALLRVHGHKIMLAEMLANLGQVWLLQGNSEAAAELLAESFELYVQLDDKGGLAYVLCGFALRETDAGSYRTALRLFGASEFIAAQAQTLPALVVRQCVARLVELLGERLASDEAAHERAIGEQCSPAELLYLALRNTKQVAPTGMESAP